MTTQDQTAPGIRSADEHRIQVSAETVKLLQANIVESKIQYFPSVGRHEVDGLSSDGDMMLTRDGEIINSAVTVFCEDWKLKKSPAANTIGELNQPQKIPSGKSVIVSTFDGISCVIIALKKAGRLSQSE